ncbi:hypothetical protein R77560_04000 [Ralstonia thomasii]|uniref:Uncharacterized protein n=1 Tax=Ralstonia thomasii TaxID=3058596 RepID=A0AAD2BTD1_9RALS|nr:hypothetical protein R77560_04000 [Ralstonia sp. LMG 18095]
MASTYGRPNHSAEAHGSFHFGRTLRADAVRLVRIRRLHHFSALLPHRLVGRCGARSSGRVFRSRARTVDGVPVGTREGRASGNTKRNENGDSENGVHDGLPHTRFPSGPVQTGISRHPAWRRLKSRLAATDCRVWGAIRFASVLLRGRWAQVLQRAEKPSGKPVRRKAQEEERARAQLRRAACQDQERGRWHPPNGAHRVDGPRRARAAPHPCPGSSRRKQPSSRGSPWSLPRAGRRIPQSQGARKAPSRSTGAKAVGREDFGDAS